LPLLDKFTGTIPHRGLDQDLPVCKFYVLFDYWFPEQSTMAGKIMSAMNRQMEKGNWKLKAALDTMTREIGPLHNWNIWGS
jgi:hypothetical protein